MLNEKLEYDLYLQGNVAAGLLSYDGLSDSLCGIRRPLLILTRGFIDLCREEDISFGETERYSKLLMRLWLGSEETFDAPEALCQTLCAAKENNLHRYVDRLQAARTGKKASAEGLQKLHEKITGKMRELSASAFGETAGQKEENDFNKITAEGIFADALLAGSLQERYFAFKPRKDYGPGEVTFQTPDQNKNEDIALAMICFYLQQKPEDQDYVPVVYMEIANWAGCQCRNKSKKESQRSIKAVRDDTAYFSYKGDPLFREHIYSNVNKLCVDPKWIADHEAKLISWREVRAAARQGFRIFCDGVSLNPSGKGLAKLPYQGR